MADRPGATARLVTDRSDATVLALDGVLDIAGVDAVRPDVASALDRDSGRLTLDLAGVSFMDSSGLALLIEIANRAEDLQLTGLPAHLRRLLEITGLLGHFQVDGVTSRRRFDDSLVAIGEARAWTATFVEDQADRVRDVVALVVSELCTNALLHSPSGFELRVERSGDSLLVEVGDDGAALPVLRDAAPEDPHGRGLRIVDELATDWGVVPADGSGKAVWARIALEGAHSTSS